MTLVLRSYAHILDYELLQVISLVEGVDAELTEIEGRDPPRHRRSRASPLMTLDGGTAAARVRAAVFVRSEYSNALVGGGFPQPAPRRANLDSAFGGMHLFAPEAWSAAPLLLTRSAQMAQPTYCAAATAVTAMGSPSLALSHLCCGLCERHCSATAGTL